MLNRDAVDVGEGKRSKATAAMETRYVIRRIASTMDHWIGKVALVTGASVGIGAEIARELAKNGIKVIATARRLDKLQELAASIKAEYKIDIYPMQCDVQKEADILRVFKWADEKLGGVDVLINNAGLLYSEPIIYAATEHYRNIMETNVIAMAVCTRELVQSIKRRNASGHIINMSSIAGHHAEMFNVPINLYAASKSAMSVMAATLRNELMNSHLDIKITNIIPGAVETNMLELGFPKFKEVDIPIMTCKDIAKIVVCILSQPPHVQISELKVIPHKVTSDTSPLVFKLP